MFNQNLNKVTDNFLISDLQRWIAVKVARKYETFYTMDSAIDNFEGNLYILMLNVRTAVKIGRKKNLYIFEILIKR